MKPYLVFYAGMLFEECDNWYSSQLPDGAYVHSLNSKAWYIVQHCSSTPLNLCDVPKELRAYVLLLT